MRVRTAPLGQLRDHVFAVVVVFDHLGRLVLCRHRDRSTWETPGGHVEPGETLHEAAARELFEETGITPRDLVAVADYDVDGVAGCLFTAEIGARSPLPPFEIAETIAFDDLPANLTYPEITPALVSAVRERRSHDDKLGRPSARPVSP